jgi:RND superfamily putative drug exporter
VQNPRGGRPAHQAAEPTTAIPAQPEPDPEATEKLTAQQAEEEGRRRGTNGGVSAADLLRREGRGR